MGGNVFEWAYGASVSAKERVSTFAMGAWTDRCSLAELVAVWRSWRCRSVISFKMITHCTVRESSIAAIYSMAIDIRRRFAKSIDKQIHGKMVSQLVRNMP